MTDEHYPLEDADRLDALRHGRANVGPRSHRIDSATAYAHWNVTDGVMSGALDAYQDRAWSTALPTACNDRYAMTYAEQYIRRRLKSGGLDDAQIERLLSLYPLLRTVKYVRGDIVIDGKPVRETAP